MQTTPILGRRRRRPAVNCTRSKGATCVYRDDAWPGTSLVQRPPQSESDDGPAPRYSSVPEPSLLTPETDAASIRAPARGGLSRATPSLSVPSADELLVDAREHGSHVRPTRDRDQQASGTASEPAVLSGLSSANTPVSTLTRSSHIETKTLNVSSGFHFHAEHRAAGQPQAVKRSVSHKTRYFGHSHWVNTVALLHDMFRVFERAMGDDASKSSAVENQCKALARIIKRRRAPPWPCPLNSDLPSRDVADALVDGYLSTSETVLRVLHIPSFRRDYEAVWAPDSNPDPAFLVQLKLVMAIGAPTYDSRFTLRPDAMRWVYEAQTWLSAPEFKTRLGIPSLQNHILLLMARDAVGIGEDMVWANVGSTLRIAMYMGLHRDPTSLGGRVMSLPMAEMRRRLWNTILELAIQSSLNSGGPPLINLDEFDTEPPGNFDDDQLTDQPAHNPPSKPLGNFTQTTVAVALRTILPQRLAAVKYLNDLSSCGTYAETLRLDAELRDAYKTLTRTLQTCKPASRGPAESTLRALDFLMRRYFLALHIPFFGPALQETSFAFSRRVAVESALRLWRAAFPTPLVSASPPSRREDGDGDAYDGPFSRIAFSGSGFFRTVACQGLVVIAVELSTLLREENGLGLQPVQLRPDLLLALQEFREWCWKSIEAGETNTKGYVMACMAEAHIEALRRGLGEEEATASMVRAVEEAVERCMGHLQVVEAQGRPAQDGVAENSRVAADLAGESNNVGYATPELGMDGWDYVASDVLFDPASEDALSWIFH
ncbi:hypothetical protein VTJ49DRAFT_5962 [Mycothermus thermophilus]|uniref:Xylanolytic transcriptional activator regulatory domain-containing protein n=1 Tax=Humicola insolens TaxID=85995 RepID=A0ABR3V2E1_HUMIN